MDRLSVEIGLIALLILLNGLFAMAELAIRMARKGRLQELAEGGQFAARDALELEKSSGRLISTMQIGITFTSTFTGAISGLFFAGTVNNLLQPVPWLNEYHYAFAFILIVFVTTFSLLVLGELLPKRIAISNPDGLALALAPSMRWLEWWLSPLVHFLNLLTNLLISLLQVSANVEAPVTQEEIKILMEQATQDGVFEESEQDMVAGVLRLGARYVNAIMTPRMEIVWLDLDDSFEENLAIVRRNQYSLYPVSRNSLDNVMGILEAKVFLSACLDAPQVDILTLIQKPLFIPETKLALEALEMVKSHGAPVALVIDEYGGLLGMVTLFDILEAIVGDIPMMGEPPEHNTVQRSDGSWLLDGMLPVDILKEILDQEFLPDEERVGYQTLGGLVLSQLGLIPAAGMFFDWTPPALRHSGVRQNTKKGDLRFKVVDMDGRRVDKVLITPLFEHIELPSAPDTVEE